jgi:hypothetical protein
MMKKTLTSTVEGGEIDDARAQKLKEAASLRGKIME